jgi:LPS-assembly lipoprotein
MLDCSLGSRCGAVPRQAARRRWLGLVAVTVAALPAAGCGFKLRGTMELPFETLYTNFPANSLTGAEFRRLVRALAGVRLVDKPEQAQARLLVLSELREREIVAFSATGRPREYQLRLRLSYRLLDAQADEWLPPAELLLRRDITTTDSQLSAKQQEEVLLYRDMQTDLVQMLLRRLASAPRRPLPGA